MRSSWEVISCNDCMCCDVFFFFSSRRRHTRSDRDWSSDVCSSDLRPLIKSAAGSYASTSESLSEPTEIQPSLVEYPPKSNPGIKAGEDKKRNSYRSEERRVGKECRSRWSPDH